MKRKITIGIILLIIFAAAFGVIYLNNVFLPVKVKGQLAEGLSTYLNYNVEIEKLKFSPIRGVVIQGVIVYDKVKDKDNTILSIKEASFPILFLPLFKERKIIIPILHVDSPYLHVRYQQDNTFNFSKIFQPKIPPPKKPKVKSSFLIYKINIFNGKCLFEDERMMPKFSKSIQDLNIVLGVRQLTKIGFLVEGKFFSADKSAVTELTLRGDYNFLSREFNSKFTAVNLLIAEFNPYIKALPFSFAGGVIDNSTLELKFKDNLASLKGQVFTKGLVVRKENLTLTGDINIEPDINYSLDKKITDYKGKIKFVQANLIGIEHVKTVSNISGDIGIEKNKLRIDNLKLQALDSDFVLKGTFENFSSPYIQFNLQSERLNLEEIYNTLPFKAEGTNLTGKATADINLKGFIGRPPPMDLKGFLQISGAKFQSPLFKEPLNNIKGRAEFTQDTIEWQDLSFNYLNQAYISTGEVTDLKSPEINSRLASKDLDLKSDIKFKDKSIRIITFAGQYLNSKFDIEGTLDTQDKDNPNMNLSVNQISINPSDTFAFLSPSVSENLKKIKLEGNLNLKGALNGRAKDFRNWNLAFKGASDAFSVYNLKFNNIVFNLDQNNGVINIGNFLASGYSGIINMSFVSNLKAEATNYLLKLNAIGIDLAKLKLDTGLKDKDMAGLLNISADLNGNFKDPGSLTGKALLSVTGGRLWQLNLFKGLGELFLLPDYEKIMFKDALGEFLIADKSISTENLRLTSDELKLDCKGSLGFDGTLDFTLYTEANKSLIRDSSDIRKFTSAILGNLSDALTIKVSGTIQKPKYKIVPVAVDVIKNLKDFFLGK